MTMRTKTSETNKKENEDDEENGDKNNNTKGKKAERYHFTLSIIE